MQYIWFACGVYCVMCFMLPKRIVLKNNNKTVNLTGILNALLCFGLIVLMCANRTGYDARSFIRFYDYVVENHSNPFDYTYELLSKVVIAVGTVLPGLSYFEFQALIMVMLGGLMIYPFIRKYAVNSGCVLSVYVACGVFACDGMQFKNFMALSFLIGALALLFGETKYKYWGYYALIFIAIAFHFSFFVYLFLPLIENAKFRQVSRYIPMVSIPIYALFFVTGNNLTRLIISFVSKITFLSKLSNYELKNVAKYSIVPFVIYFAALLIIEYYNQNQRFISDKTQKIVTKFIFIWRYMGIFLPFLVVSNAVYRIYRNLLVVLFLIATNIVLETPAGTRRRYIYTILLLLFLYLVYMYIVLLGSSVDIYEPVINGTLFWIDE